MCLTPCACVTSLLLDHDLFELMGRDMVPALPVFVVPPVSWEAGHTRELQACCPPEQVPCSPRSLAACLVWEGQVAWPAVLCVVQGLPQAA